MSTATEKVNNTVTASAAAVPPTNGTHSATAESLETAPFDLELLHAITAANTIPGQGSENALIAPFLLEALLALLYLGSDGNTAVELKRLLQLQRFPSNAKMAQYFAAHLEVMAVGSDVSEIELHSQILMPDTAELAGEEFSAIARKYFQTAVLAEGEAGLAKALDELLGSSVDRQRLVAEEEAVNEDDKGGDLTANLLLGAGFRFKWFLPFSAYRSGIYDFHVPSAVNGQDLSEEGKANTTASTTTTTINMSPVAVPMLFDDDMFVKFGEFRELDARAIELPCEHDALELTMLLVLPNRRDGLPEMMEKLRRLDLHTLSEERMQMESVQVLLPKFKIDYSRSMRPTLEKLGLTSLFTKAANLKNFAAGLRIGDLWHRSTIEVNESGSMPSNVAVSKPIVISNSINSKQKFFRADHPFFFAIRADAVTYFAGLVMQCSA